MKFEYKDELYHAQVLTTPTQFKKAIQSKWCLEIQEIGMGIMDPQHTMTPLTKPDLDDLIAVPEIHDDAQFVEWLTQLKQESIVDPTWTGYTVEPDDEVEDDDEE